MKWNSFPILVCTERVMDVNDLKLKIPFQSHQLEKLGKRSILFLSSHFWLTVVELDVCFVIEQKRHPLFAFCLDWICFLFMSLNVHGGNRIFSVAILIAFQAIQLPSGSLMLQAACSMCQVHRDQTKKGKWYFSASSAQIQSCAMNQSRNCKAWKTLLALDPRFWH